MNAELIRGTLALLVLSLAGERPMYGYEMVCEVRERTRGTFQWKEGSLYPNLHKLERGGLLESRWEGSEGERRRKYYALTPAGRGELARRREEWGRLVRAVGQVMEAGDGTS